MNLKLCLSPVHENLVRQKTTVADTFLALYLMEKINALGCRRLAERQAKR